MTFTHSSLAVLAENLLLLRQAEYRGQLHQLLSVLKLRFGQPDATFQSYQLVPGRGFVLLGTTPPAEGWLTGLARPIEGVSGDVDHDPAPRVDGQAEPDGR